MTRDEFLKKFFLMFPGLFTKENLIIWFSAYKEVIPALETDFEELNRYMIKNWNSVHQPPPPAWLKEAAKACRKRQLKEIIDVDVVNWSDPESIRAYRKTCVPAPKEFFEAKEALLLKVAERSTWTK
jgi:hypothetical protein